MAGWLHIARYLGSRQANNLSRVKCKTESSKSKMGQIKSQVCVIFPPFLAANASLCVCTEGKTQEFIFNKYINESRLEYALFGGPKLYNSYKFYLHESFFI